VFDVGRWVLALLARSLARPPPCSRDAVSAVGFHARVGGCVREWGRARGACSSEPTHTLCGRSEPTWEAEDAVPFSACPT
jgi:hypothetical protein